MRWLVERPTGLDTFEDVGAAYVALGHGGTLSFFDENHELTVAYAPGQWLTVVPEAEGA
jgi:hypothetical protein